MAQYRFRDWANEKCWNYPDDVEDMEIKLQDPKPNSIVLNSTANDEMIRIAPDGFYVRGKKVPQDDQEAEVVYTAFKQWLAWAQLQRR